MSRRVESRRSRRGAQLREEAAAGARQILLEGERAAAQILDEARVDAGRVREDALTEAERVKAAIVDHARETAASEARQLREDAQREAESLRASLLDEARREAEGIRAEAEQEKRSLLHEAEEEAVRLHVEAAAQISTPEHRDGDVKLLRAGEICGRDFPLARRGFDRASVQKWLDLVATSYALLEDELHRARRAWERALDLLETTRIPLGSVDALDGSPGRCW